MSASAEARAFGDMMPLRHHPVTTTRPKDALDPNGPQVVVFNPAALFDYGADLAHSQAQFLAQNGERREEPTHE